MSHFWLTRILESVLAIVDEVAQPDLGNTQNTSTLFRLYSDIPRLGLGTLSRDQNERKNNIKFTGIQHPNAVEFARNRYGLMRALVAVW